MISTGAKQPLNNYLSLDGEANKDAEILTMAASSSILCRSDDVMIGRGKDCPTTNTMLNYTYGYGPDDDEQDKEEKSQGR